ncbi:MAG: hypothetical protein U0361_21540 [Nitrospiraceae bacterium]
MLADHRSRQRPLAAAGIQQGKPATENHVMRTTSWRNRSMVPVRRPPSAPWGGAIRWWKLQPKDRWRGRGAAREQNHVLLVPGQDLTNDGIVLQLYGFLVRRVNHPPNQASHSSPKVSMLRASVRTHPVRYLGSPAQ